MSTTPIKPANSSQNPAALALDTSIGGGLLLALACVLFMSPAGAENSPIQPGPTEQVEVEEVVEESPPLRLAVTTKEFDDLGHTLKQLGPGFDQFTVLSVDDLLNPSALDQIDVLFLTCGTVPVNWVEKELGASARKGTISIQVKEEIYSKFCENLAAFVNRGGTLYASDLRYGPVVRAFPNVAPTMTLGEGVVQTVTASVDSSLTTLIGHDIELRFDQEGWRPAAFDENQVDVLLQGDFKNLDGESVHSPLLVRFRSGEGTVIFTSFHNEKQNSAIEQKLLKALVFATILAKSQSKTTRMLMTSGFKPVGNSMIGAAGATQAVTQTYHAANPATLRFSVGFESRGGILKLTVKPPTGAPRTQQGSASFDFEVTSDQPGDWQYTVEAVKSPPGDFPFTLTFGEK